MVGTGYPGRRTLPSDSGPDGSRDLSFPDVLADRPGGINCSFLWMEHFSRAAVPLGISVLDDSDTRDCVQPDHVSLAVTGLKGCQHDLALDGRSCFTRRQC